MQILEFFNQHDKFLGRVTRREEGALEPSNDWAKRLVADYQNSKLEDEVIWERLSTRNNGYLRSELVE